MTFKALAASAAAIAVAASSTAAFAQAAAAPAAPSVTHGPALNGVCILSVEGAVGTSTVGRYVDTRMQQILTQVQAELNAEKTAIDNEAKTLDTQRATLAPDALEKRAADLQVRANAFQRKAQLRDRELQATEQKAYARVTQEMEPAIRQAYQAKQCSVLVQRSAVVLANPAMDLTPQVVTALNAKVTQFAFDRERLDAQPGAAAAGR
jgi:Skp family chaperone for outer membrane proteins